MWEAPGRSFLELELERIAVFRRVADLIESQASRADERHGPRRRVSAASARRWLVAVASDGHTVHAETSAAASALRL
jgi:hypothetical protein